MNSKPMLNAYPDSLGRNLGETKERRIRRNRDENAASPFICRVVELEQEKLEVQRKNAGLIVGKDGSVYEQ